MSSHIRRFASANWVVLAGGSPLARSARAISHRVPRLLRSIPPLPDPLLASIRCSPPCGPRSIAKSPVSRRGLRLSRLATSYFPRGLHPKYHRRWRSSRSCSGWVRVFPLRHRHQTILRVSGCLPGVSPGPYRPGLFRVHWTPGPLETR